MLLIMSIITFYNYFFYKKNKVSIPCFDYTYLFFVVELLNNCLNKSIYNNFILNI